ncbi:MAG: amino acid adenylation domain-containing protein, partial [Betaproteobacteria bacterium]
MVPTLPPDTSPRDGGGPSALAAEPVLAGLFGLGGAGTGGARQTHGLALPAATRSALETWASRAGGLADTPLLAAWMLMLGRWSGVASQVGADLGEHTACFGATIASDASAAAWLAAVDSARRAATRDGTAGASEWAWASGQAVPAPAPTLIVLRAPVSAGSIAPATLDADFAADMPPTLANLLLERIAAVAQSLCAQPDGLLGAIDLLGDDVRVRLLQRPVPRAADSAVTVHAAFSQQAARHPASVALRHLDERVTYAELEDRSTRLAARLLESGVRAGALVGVALDRSPMAIVALLAVLKAGAGYLPLDSAYPRDRIAFMLEDAEAVLVVTSRSKAAAFEGAVPVLVLDGADAPVDGACASAVAHIERGTAGDVAYVMYTSGSTGTPKGVTIPHDAILRLVVGAEYVHLATDTVMLHAAPLGFDASTLEIWGPLLNGGCCVLHPEELPTPAGLAATIGGAGVTTAWLTAALFNAVVDDDARHLDGLRELLIGGEALSVAHCRRLLDAVPGVTLINGYGPTESTTFATTWRIPRPLAVNARSVPIGKPITDTQALILGPGMELLPPGLAGKLHVGGRGLAIGYLKRPELTAERFVAHPFAAGERLYDTGDLVRQLPGGEIDFIGRADQQVKIRGFRIELGEIESALAAHPAVQAAAVIAWRDATGDASLAAYLVAKPGAVVPLAADQRADLAKTLPEFMLPTAFVWLDRFPITVNGKLDRAALPRPAPARPELVTPYQAPQDAVEETICTVFADVLGLDRVGRLDNFFELGGNSLQVLKSLGRLAREGVAGLSATMFFRQPTAQALARVLADAVSAAGAPTPAATPAPSAAAARVDDEPIAIIAVAGRFPGARDVEAFWDNLCQGRDGITHFGADELDPSLAAALVGDPNYVKARGVVDDVDLFDPAFFGISPREAELMDPQQRLFMELCWECLERGGHVPDAADMPIGVFAGMNNATYFRHHVQSRPDLIDKLGEFAVMLANEKDYIATRTANRLNLTGPAVSIHTACSTSLVTIAQAFWSLRQGQCRMALAGGSSITCPPRSGYLYQEGAMLSPDGRTRSFDADAQGTVFSDGVAVVLLKRLSDAIADGNDVIALIRGVGVNNDGRDKASFTAPSVDGQVAVIAQAHAVAGVDPRTISYVETHGTATPLGDPVEVEALTVAFRRATADTGFCRIGSVKSNIGHLVYAAGATGVIKTALALANETLPATLHVTQPNPKIAFAQSPFVVNDRASAWPRTDAPRRAGVSSFGVGGTNAHAVLEEAPLRAPSSPAQGPQRLQLAARTPTALAAMAARLAVHLEQHPQANLADVAFTLQHGRSAFTHRLAVVAATPDEAVQALAKPGHAASRHGSVGPRKPPLVWLFPGQGAQYAGMASGLAATDPAFAHAFEAALDAIQPALAFDLRARLADADAQALRPTAATQPALFCIEYALAACWQSRGLQPAALIGHSVGEFVAAAIAGVMPLADAARLVAHRGALLQALPEGAMLSVRLPVADVLARMPSTLSLAAENAPGACVVAGPSADIDAWAAVLQDGGTAAR